MPLCGLLIRMNERENTYEGNRDHYQWRRVKRILSAFSKNGIFVSQGFGYGHQQGYHQVYTRDDNRGVNMLPKVSVRTVVADDLVDPIVNEMVSSMGNATFGDGKIFIKDVAEAIRVRTGETGDAAL